MSVRWVETDKHVYGAIYREHYENLKPFATCTCPDGDISLGKPNPYILTEWGLIGADEPVIKSVGTKESRDQKDYDYRYFIAQVKHDKD